MLADLNGDGNLDAVVTEDGNSTAHVYLGDGKGGFTSGQQNIPYPFVDELPAQIGDANGDGIPDLLLPADGSIGIALGTGKGTFLTPIVVGGGPQEGQILLENLHGQSPTADLPDLVAPDSIGGVMVLLNLTK
jgi:FG-GAP-like repeat